MPKWRNGRRTRLKILRGQLHVGSSPTFGTKLQAQKPVFLCNKSDNPKLMGLERAGYRKVASGKFSLPRRDSVAEQVPLSAPNYRLKSLFFLCNKSDNPKLMGLERAGYRKVASGKFSLPRRDSVAEQVPLSAPITGSKACFFLCYPKAKLKLDYIFSIDKISATHNC